METATDRSSAPGDIAGQQHPRICRADAAPHDARLESRLDERINGLESQISELRERRAKLEGLLEGLREAITVRASAS